jgi:ferredoxin
MLVPINQRGEQNMVKVSVDFRACKSTGLCCLEAADVFSLDDKGYLSVVEVVDESRRAAVESAADLCPNQAITVE